MKLDSDFDIADAVFIDGDRSVRAVVVAVRWSRDGIQYEVGWMHSGRSEFCYFDAWRLSK